nr:hypothetical protein [Butyricicoccus sp. AM18-35]
MTKEQIAAITVVLLLGVVFLCGCTVGSRNRRKSRQSRGRCQRPEKCAVRCAARKQKSRANSGSVRGVVTPAGSNKVWVQKQPG